MRTSSRSLVVVVFPELELLDVTAPLGVFTSAGRAWNWRPFKVTLAGSTALAVSTCNQLELGPVTALADCPAPELLLVPGGYGARRALDDVELVEWLADVGRRATHLLGVGAGVLLLGRAGLLDGVSVAAPAQTVPSLLELAPSARPTALHPEVLDGKVATAVGGGAALRSALRVLASLLGERQARAVAQELGYPWEGGGVKIEIVG